MKRVTLGTTKTMIDMHNTNSCNLAWQFQTNRKTNLHTHKNHGSVLMESFNRSMASFCHCWSAYAEKKLRLNKVAMEFEDCFRDPGLK